MPRWTVSDNVLSDEIFKIAKNQKQDAFQRGFTSMVYYFFNKRSSDSSVTHALSETLVLRDKSAIKVEIMLNQQLAEDLSKKIIRKFNERKGYLCFKDNA